MDALKPSMQLLAKIGSLLVHLEEGLSDNGHSFDLMALSSGMKDPDVREWIREMGPLVPKKRTTPKASSQEGERG